MKSLLTAIFLLFGSLLFAQRKDQCYLLFAARGASLRPYSFTGHAFVSWGRLKEQDSVVRAPLTLGFFPANHNASVFSYLFTNMRSEVVPGFVPNSKRLLTYQLVLKVDFAHWQAALDTAYAWQGSKYSLLRRNCVSFMDAVADAAGLKTPRTHVLGFPRRPKRYLKKLLKINKLHIMPVPNIHYEDGQPAKGVVTLR